VIDVAIPIILLHLVYWGSGAALFYLDVRNGRWWASIKCQPKAKPLPSSEVWKICAVVEVQLLTVYPLVMWLAAPLLRTRLQYDVESLPDSTTIALSFGAFAVCSEIWFYHVHWLLHRPSLYPYCHKMHHEYTAPIAFECLYFHPVESVLQMGTAALGPALLGSHVMLLYAWIVVVLFNVSLHHCGHEVPFDEAPKLGSMTHQHDYHHKVFNANFGVIGLCDMLYGTRGGYDDYHKRWKDQRGWE